jgi:hypothetical protein
MNIGRHSHLPECGLALSFERGRIPMSEFIVTRTLEALAEPGRLVMTIPGRVAGVLAASA